MKTEDEESATSHHDVDLERSWMMLERVIRSTAHSVGNAINVVSGRLSLLELDDGLGTEGREAIRLVRERLRRTHAELKGAVAFAYARRPSSASEGVVSALLALSQQLQIPISGLGPEIRGSYVSRVDLSLPLRTLAEANTVLGVEPGWGVSEGPAGLVLTVSCNAETLPADRRTALEPWFEEGAHEIDEPLRYARLLLAIALGRLEEGGGNISVREQQMDCSKITVVAITWPP